MDFSKDLNMRKIRSISGMVICAINLMINASLSSFYRDLSLWEMWLILWTSTLRTEFITPYVDLLCYPLLLLSSATSGFR